jgi:hypothetical protein
VTQVEVPQVSLQRYLDLLKRRRWQVIPVSLIGLVIGGLVAFFIPRYYVAETLLQHQQVPGQKPSRNVEDPFRSIVDSAKTTIPLAVPETLEKLGWPESKVQDPFERTQKERAVMKRVLAEDVNLATRDRDFAQMRVTYRDRDGERSARFLNALIDAWIQKRLGELREPAEEEYQLAKEEVGRQRHLHDQLRQEKQRLEAQYGLDPTLDPINLSLQWKRELDALPKPELAKKESELAGMRVALEAKRQLLDRTERRVAPDADALLEEAAKTPAGETIVNFLLYWRRALLNYREGTYDHRKAQRQIAEYEKALRELVSNGGVGEDGKVPNPGYEKTAELVRQMEQRADELQAECSVLQARIEEEEKLLQRRALGMTLYQSNRDALEQTKKGLDLASERLREADVLLGQLGRQQTIKQIGKANPPPHPTEPNILVIALIGCALGLGVAIGLILLLDLLQGTFKTIEDVERAVTVPVLGGMSHLETDADRQVSARRRRRVSVTAGAFVTLCVAIVIIFYVDPTRLPPIVRDLLALLLGA